MTYPYKKAVDPDGHTVALVAFLTASVIVLQPVAKTDGPGYEVNITETNEREIHDLVGRPLVDVDPAEYNDTLFTEWGFTGSDRYLADEMAAVPQSQEGEATDEDDDDDADEEDDGEDESTDGELQSASDLDGSKQPAATDGTLARQIAAAPAGVSIDGSGAGIAIDEPSLADGHHPGSALSAGHSDDVNGMRHTADAGAEIPATTLHENDQSDESAKNDAA